jgi:hypothetical protein
MSIKYPRPETVREALEAIKRDPDNGPDATIEDRRAWKRRRDWIQNVLSIVEQETKK